MPRLNSIEDFWKHVNKEGSFPAHVPELGRCWIWTAYCAPAGYGEFWIDGRKIGAHVFSWKLHFGQIEPGFWILHKCDNPACIRPDHLFKGTPRDNSRDASAKGRLSHGEDRPLSKLTAKDVSFIRFLAAGGMAGRQIAREFHVSSVAVNKIIRRLTWRHVT